MTVTRIMTCIMLGALYGVFCFYRGPIVFPTRRKKSQYCSNYCYSTNVFYFHCFVFLTLDVEASSIPRASVKLFAFFYLASLDDESQQIRDPLR